MRAYPPFNEFISPPSQVSQEWEFVSCTCGTFVDSDLFISGSSDTILRIWRMYRKDGTVTMSETHMLRGHSGSVSCVAACRAWSIIVSGSEDGTAIIWDLNRAVYANTIHHRDLEDVEESTGVHCVAINDSTVSYFRAFSHDGRSLHFLGLYSHLFK